MDNGSYRTGLQGGTHELAFRFGSHGKTAAVHLGKPPLQPGGACDSSGLFYYGDTRDWRGLISWLILLPCALWLGLRLSPLTAKWRGYGSVRDTQPSKVAKTPVQVTIYSHDGCPFCPVLTRRLKALQKEMNFTLREIDLTFKPQIAANKGIKSVPVVEVGGSRLLGNVTTEQLAEFIAGAKTSAAASAQPV